MTQTLEAPKEVEPKREVNEIKAHQWLIVNAPKIKTADMTRVCELWDNFFRVNYWKNMDGDWKIIVSYFIEVISGPEGFEIINHTINDLNR